MNYDGYYKERTKAYLNVNKVMLITMIKHGVLIKDENIENALRIIEEELEIKRSKEQC